MGKLKNKAYAIVEVVSHEDLVTRKFDVFDIFIVVLIILNIVAVIFETVQPLAVRFGPVFRYFEIFSVIVFSIEYILRVWTCTVNARYRSTIKGRIKYVLSPLAVIDLFAILPFYLPILIPFDLRFLRAFRLFRLVRILKIGRYSEAAKLFGKVLKAKKEELVTAAFVIFILLIISSSLLYFVEHEAQPNKFKNIPEAMWWGVMTLTTVGYGDIYPVTAIGKLLASIMSLLGIGLFAMPAGILAAGFVEEIRTKKEAVKKCPHCGTKIE